MESERRVVTRSSATGKGGGGVREEDSRRRIRKEESEIGGGLEAEGVSMERSSFRMGERVLSVCNFCEGD